MYNFGPIASLCVLELTFFFFVAANNPDVQISNNLANGGVNVDIPLGSVVTVMEFFSVI